MTEVEWLACDDPAAMLEGFPAEVSPRKRSLFVCAVGRSALPFFRGLNAVGVLDIAERVADGCLALASLPRTGALEAVMAYRSRCKYGSVNEYLAGILEEAFFLDPRPATSLALNNLSRFEVNTFGQANGAFHVALIREVFGNPFHFVTIDPSWLTSTVVILASQMYESRDFCAMPILADALQDAGCDNEQVLTHCRGPGPHVRGCWVVDLVLGKE